MLRVFLLALLCGVSQVWADCSVNSTDQARVIKLSGAALSERTAFPIARLSLMAYRDGAFVPVPFQIDEMDVQDLVWFKQTDFKHSGIPGLLDGKDQLLAMVADAGAKAPAQARPRRGRPLAEFEVAGECYLYLVLDNPERSPRQYVKHNIETGITRTDYYQLDADPHNELNWHHLGFKTYQGEGSIIDTLKMRMSAGVLSPFTRMTLDNHNLKPELVAFKTGPIRSTMHLRTKVVLAGIPVMTLQVQAQRYAAHYEAHTYARIPGLYRATLRDPTVSVTIDGNAQYGAKVYTARYPDPAVVDGRVGDDDRALINAGLTLKESWILFDSQKQFAMLTRLDVPEGLGDMPLALVYQDDETQELEPEQYPGQLPNLGYALRGWPKPKELRFAVTLFFDKGLHGFSAPVYARRRGEPVPTRIRWRSELLPPPGR